MDQENTHVIWRFGQIALAGAFVIAAGLIHEIQSRPSASPIIQELKAIEKKVAKAPPVRPPDGRAENFLEKAKEAASISDLRKLRMPRPAGRLIEAMEADEFDRGNPFLGLNSVYPLALILDHGVESFRRDAYRSNHFLGGVGYDVVKYEIRHPGGGLSYILAYKEKTGPNQIAIGHSDARPTFSLFVVPQEDNQVYLSLYQDGQPVQNNVVDRDLGLRQVTSRINQSTPLMTARD